MKKIGDSTDTTAGHTVARLVAICSCAALAITLLLAWLLSAPGYAFDFDSARLQQSMQTSYGARGVQALNNWFRLLQQQTGQSTQQQLQAVNTFWNDNVLGSDDMTVWGVVDYWATPLESLGKGAGDCEDYVIGKYFSLLRLGVPTEKLRLIYVRARLGGQSIAHMVMGYYETPTSEPLVLDNMLGDILPASQRPDLTPVFSFNGQGVYVAGSSQTASVDRIDRWRGLLIRMQQEGFNP